MEEYVKPQMDLIELPEDIIRTSVVHNRCCGADPAYVTELPDLP